MNFEEERLNQVFKGAIQHNMSYLYQLKLTEDRAMEDCKVAARNLQLWVSNMFDPEKNSYGITYD